LAQLAGVGGVVAVQEDLPWESVKRAGIEVALLAVSPAERVLIWDLGEQPEGPSLHTATFNIGYC